MTKMKKFVEGSKKDMVKMEDVIGEDDWVLTWSPDSSHDQSGFTLFTPKAFDPNVEGGPMGGLILAALYFLIENGDGRFPRELISRANDLSKELEERTKPSSSMSVPPGRTLN